MMRTNSPKVEPAGGVHVTWFGLSWVQPGAEPPPPTVTGAVESATVTAPREPLNVTVFVSPPAALYVTTLVPKFVVTVPASALLAGTSTSSRANSPMLQTRRTGRGNATRLRSFI